MKTKRALVSMFIVALALAAQLSFITPVTQARQNTNSSTTMEGSQNGNVGIPTSTCRRKCLRTYRQCLIGGKNKTACRAHLRNCLRRCPQ